MTRLWASLEEMGVDTGIDVMKMIENGRRAEEVIGYPLRANVIRSGPVNHGPKEYDPYAKARAAATEAEAS